MRITSSIVLATENSILVVPKFWECIYPQYSWIRSFRNIVFLASRLLSAHLDHTQFLDFFAMTSIHLIYSISM